MLVELTISNIAIIESLRLQFGPGFGVLTGETGTGKSIIVDAVSLLLGGRASSDLIRTGYEAAAVEGIFAPDEAAQAALAPLLEEQGLDGSQLILRREISRRRRNICRVNGRAVTMTTLQAIGRHLIDIHGQGEHLSLLNVRNHLDFLDRYGGTVAQRQAFAAKVAELRRVRAEMAALQRDERELARRIDLLGYQIEEIRAANLVPGEEDDLKRRRSLLANAEKRMQLAASVYSDLAEGDGDERSATDLLGRVFGGLSTLADLDDTLSGESKRVEDALYQLEELARTIRNYRDDVEYDPEGLRVVEERIDLIQSLKRKYGDVIDDILAYAGRAEAELDAISHSEERIEALGAQEQTLLGELAVLAEALSARRTETAGALRAAIEDELADLNMEQARFLIRIDRKQDPNGVEIDRTRYGFDATGVDQVEFFIAPNPGEDPKPLARTASGGETSRLMLAMKTSLSSIDPVPTLIFDEIDSGIGGRTGDIVGRKLWSLARTHQVFCVTHLAQIAAYAGEHYRVAKQVVGERTVSVAQRLDAEQRVEEVAVLLGGAVTPTTRKSAEELLTRSRAET